ncbi:unnamed protein product [Ostreobium quekettii]|uniref:Uncharacterized protein n=1 Tax=Ostreobium quekettii TaxID=121088 RepID=A0A8S1JEB4_9CHLO|nr:unnamed protein product [Ostreobium quekettii]|eukprot:evm.model.scf_438.6 EVM.evm.TU.scf_438.6   scf_438:68030-68722(-)
MGGTISIRNDTPFVMQVSLDQVGPLYYSNKVQPGQTFFRKTGSVHFTVKCRWYQGKDISDWSVAAPILYTTVGAVTLAAFGAVAAAAVAGAAAAEAGVVAAGGAAAAGAAEVAAVDVGAAVAGGMAGGVVGAGATAGIVGANPSEGLCTTRLGEQTLHWVDGDRRMNAASSLKACVREHRNWFEAVSLGWFAGNHPRLRLVGGPKMLGKDSEGNPILDLSKGSPLRLQRV